MKRTLMLAARTWALGLTAYAFVWTREVPVAYAIGFPDSEPCPTLDQPNTTYHLTSNITGGCIIAADNIILDGDGLYSISGSVTDEGYGYTFTLQNVVAMTGNAYSYAGLTVIDSQLDGYANGYTGLTVTDSEIGGYIVSTQGSVTLTDSTVTEDVGAHNGATISGSATAEVFVSGGDISITDSEVNGYVGGSATTTSITIQNSTIDATGNPNEFAIYGNTVAVTNSTLIEGDVYGHDSVSLSKATIGGDVYGYSGPVEILNDSSVSGYAEAYNGPLTITDSTVNEYVLNYTGDLNITNATIGAYAKADNGSLILTDSDVGGNATGETDATITNSTVGGDAIAYSGSLTLTDSDVVGGAYGQTDATITNSTVGGDVYQYLGSLNVIDSMIAGSVYSPVLSVTDNPPELTVTPLTLELEQGESFDPLSGVTAHDNKDGDLSDDVSVTGTVGEAAGTYELVYSVTDQGTTLFNEFDSATTTSGPSTASTTRTVTRLAAASGGGHSESTRVGKRSSSHASDTSPSSNNASFDAILGGLQSILSEPITGANPDTMKKLLPLLQELAALLAKLAALPR
jgi:hypothetical protein